MMTDEELGSIRPLLIQALKEDIGSGDQTSEAVIDNSARARADYVAKEPVVACGLEAVREVVLLTDPELRFEILNEDGAALDAGGVLARVEGRARSILAAERTSLNILQRLTGIATLTREYVSRVRGTGAKILDTRKTVPGYRMLDKYAVRCGGGTNHRIGLYDAVLIKNNHLVFCSGPGHAVRKARGALGPGVPVEVEVASLEELREAIESGASRVLIDNFSVPQARQAVGIAAGKVELEASGGITLETVGDYAHTGVDYISVGALTHSVRAADIHLRLHPTIP